MLDTFSTVRDCLRAVRCDSLHGRRSQACSDNGIPFTLAHKQHDREENSQAHIVLVCPDTPKLENADTAPPRHYKPIMAGPIPCIVECMLRVN
jgi:hypothetical protein